MVNAGIVEILDHNAGPPIRAYEARFRSARRAHAQRDVRLKPGTRLITHEVKAYETACSRATAAGAMATHSA